MAQTAAARAAAAAAAATNTVNNITLAVPGLRPVTKVVQGQKMSEGAGVRICRTLGTTALRNLDPFLMLDEMKSPAENFPGFPSHPHRGFETCSIMLSGRMEHKDSAGNQGVIGPGGVQWMTAGRGVIHSEMPKAETGLMWGFQLWINLPAKDKMVKPRYQDYQADQIPEVTPPEGGRVRVMAGESGGIKGPIVLRNPGMLLDVTLPQGASWEQEIPKEWAAFAYVCVGAGSLSNTPVSIEKAYVFGEGDKIAAKAEHEEGLRFLLAAGKPIGEPIVQYGPFVMNTKAEIGQAFEDYQNGKLQNPDDDVWASWNDEK